MGWDGRKSLKGVILRAPLCGANNWGPLSSTFHVERPETLIEWKFESMTIPTDRQTWVGARDTCVSKNV